MLKSISWEEYFFAVAMIAAGYYVIIIAAFYSRDILRMLKEIPSSERPAIKERHSNSDSNLMGGIHENVFIRKNVEATVTSEEIEVSNSQTSEEGVQEGYSGLLDELKSLFQIMQEGNATKEDYLNHVKTSLSRYIHFMGTLQEAEINSRIISDLKDLGMIDITDMEIRGLWPRELNHLVNNNKSNNYAK